MHEEIFQQIRTFIIKKLDPAFIIIFGSYAKGTTHSESDIDVAFYRENHSFSSYELFMFAQQLADIIGIEVDLIDLKETSTVFAAQIFSTGEVIYSKNDNLRMELHMRTYSMYTRLNEERQPIIDKLLNRVQFTESDVILNKITVIERCHARIKDVNADDSNNLTDFTKQDSIVLNIQRACKACIDLAMHVSAEKKFGIPQKNREAFELLHANNVILEETATNMKSMVGFRNIAVHD